MDEMLIQRGKDYADMTVPSLEPPSMDKLREIFPEYTDEMRSVLLEYLLTRMDIEARQRAAERRFVEHFDVAKRAMRNKATGE